MKTQILAAIGETELQPAAALNAALAANDRLKYAFSLLQMAVDHAGHPKQEAETLKRDRVACGIDDPTLDATVAGARMAGASCRVPGAAAIMARIAGDVRVMAAPVLATKGDGMRVRVEGVLGVLPPATGDLLDPAAVASMMQAGHGGPDSIHRLVMDLHKRLNALQAALATEVLDGAAVYNLSAPDRALVSAFMAGLRRTAGLKFGHPGLDTTATRAGGRLLIQNDIGTTDAHVIVVHVEGDDTKGRAVSVTYTDVHAERLAFFQDMLKPYAVAWKGARTAVLAAGAPFYMATGRIEVKDAAGCGAYLDALGSRLVFLIDWNRARKQLRGFLRGPDRLALLAWAAEAGVGHRGFLELGGAELINRAVEAAAGPAMRFGDRLCDVLGDAAALEFLRFVFQTATRGLLAGQPHGLIQDRIQVALAGHFTGERRQRLRVAEEHAGLVFELASLVRDGLQAEAAHPERRTRRAAGFERDADHLVLDMRDAVRRRPDHAVFLPLLEAADDAADALEGTVFLLGLDALHGKALEALQALADLLLEASEEWIKALGHAGQAGLAPGPAGRGGAELDDVLAAVSRIAVLRQQADEAARTLTAEAVLHADGFRQLHLFTASGGKLQAAAVALQRACLILRGYVLEGVAVG